jgi:pyruvate formate lyase activating enzyme
MSIVGNIPGQEGEDTLCPGCGRTVIERVGFRVTRKDIIEGECRHCRTKIEGVWD